MIGIVWGGMLLGFEMHSVGFEGFKMLEQFLNLTYPISMQQFPFPFRLCLSDPNISCYITNILTLEYVFSRVLLNLRSDSLVKSLIPTA